LKNTCSWNIYKVKRADTSNNFHLFTYELIVAFLVLRREIINVSNNGQKIYGKLFQMCESDILTVFYVINSNLWFTFKLSGGIFTVYLYFDFLERKSTISADRPELVIQLRLIFRIFAGK